MGPVEDRGGASGAGYFDAVARTAVGWDGHAAASCDGGPGAVRDLSDHLRLDLGHFTSRDELFARHGRTLCLPGRVAAGRSLLSHP
ncbi:hypothetical protein ACFVRU_13295 [Streptomyces sp. NPDC057927]